MIIQIRRESAITYVTVESKSIQFENVDSFLDELKAQLHSNDTLLAFDLTRVGFIDSRGLGSLLSLYKTRGPHGRLCVFNVADNVRKVFVLTRTDKLIGIAADAVAAQELLTAVQAPNIE